MVNTYKLAGEANLIKFVNILRRFGSVARDNMFLNHVFIWPFVENIEVLIIRCLWARVKWLRKRRLQGFFHFLPLDSLWVLGCFCWYCLQLSGLGIQSGRDHGTLTTHCTKTREFLCPDDFICLYVHTYSSHEHQLFGCVLVPWLPGNLSYKSVKKALF